MLIEIKHIVRIKERNIVNKCYEATKLAQFSIIYAHYVAHHLFTFLLQK